MAKYFYANTWHPELFSKILDKWGNNDQANTIEYDGKKWCRIPFSKEARIEFNDNSGLNDFNISFECAIPPLDRNAIKASDVFRESSGMALGINFRSYIFLGKLFSDEKEVVWANRCPWYYPAGRPADELESMVSDWIKTGNWPSADYSMRTGFGLENNLKLMPSFKVFIHVSKGNGEVTTSVGKGAKVMGYVSDIDAIYFSGVYIRNIIISEEPISYSDTIREVTVDSITGNSWYTSNGKSFTENVNTAATVRLNSQSLAEAKRALDARKFAFSGITNRQGERINALEVKRANEAHQSFVDIGEHTFGSSWNVNSPNEISDTLTITTRKVVGR